MCVRARVCVHVCVCVASCQTSAGGERSLFTTHHLHSARTHTLSGVSDVFQLMPRRQRSGLSEPAHTRTCTHVHVKTHPHALSQEEETMKQQNPLNAKRVFVCSGTSWREPEQFLINRVKSVLLESIQRIRSHHVHGWRPKKAFMLPLDGSTAPFVVAGASIAC